MEIVFKPKIDITEIRRAREEIKQLKQELIEVIALAETVNHKSKSLADM